MRLSAVAQVRFPHVVVLTAWAIVASCWHAVRAASPPDVEPRPPAFEAANAPTDRVARGGGQQADFDSLIELIQTTIAPDTWQDVGGEGAISGFPGGVYVDTAGVLRPAEGSVQQQLAALWDLARQQGSQAVETQDFRRGSRRRKISLHRLQQELARRRAESEPLSLEIRFLAGLQRVDLVFLDEQAKDCILVGPAGAWTLNEQGRYVGIDSGRPVVRLDDLVVMLRNAFRGDGQFLCAITPLQENLERTQQYLAEWAGRPVRSGQRESWLEGLREALGRQQIEFAGIDADTRVARVLIEADHHMKLIGLGLVPAAGDLVSYLDSLAESADGPPPELGVLRWWFALRARCVQQSESGEIFYLPHQVVRVLSENELLAARGQRVHTGRAEPLNAQFARDFTADFAALAQRYPVYAELDNLFRLAIVAAVLRRGEFPQQAGWSLDDLLDDATYAVPRARVPKSVFSVVNYRAAGQRYFLAAVSGGVTFRADHLFAHGFDTAPRSEAIQPATLQVPGELPADVWWWD